MMLGSSHVGSVIPGFAHCRLKGTFHFISDNSASPRTSPRSFCHNLSSPLGSCTGLPTCVLSFVPSSLLLGIPFSSSLSLHSFISFHSSLDALCLTALSSPPSQANTLRQSPAPRPAPAAAPGPSVPRWLPRGGICSSVLRDKAWEPPPAAAGPGALPSTHCGSGCTTTRRDAPRDALEIHVTHRNLTVPSCP